MEDLREVCNGYERQLAEAQLTHGPDSYEVAAALEKYAEFLRSKKTRVLDAANMEARANVIRAESRCAKCEGNMERGITTAGGLALLWIDTENPNLDARARFKMMAYRCSRCSRVEFFARENASS